MLIKLAWRNIWRNKRRTTITVSSIFFAVLLALFMRSMQLGSYSRMIETSVEMYSGYIQVHDSGYWENKSINRLLEITPEVTDKVTSVEGVKFVIPRLENFALAASDELTKGVQVIGTDPETETAMTELADKVIEGEYFGVGGQGVMVTSGLADYLNLGLNDTIILLGQGYHGTNAVGKYPITALVKQPNPELNKVLVYMPLKLAQQFNGAPNMASAMVVMLDDYQKMNKVQAAIQAQFDSDFEVMNWEEMQPELVQLIESDNAGGIIMLLILYIVIAFGIFGTIMMMTVERTREFGVLIAIGMQKPRLISLVGLETFFIGIFGMIISTLAGIPLLYYMFLNPIQMQGEMAQTMEEFGMEPVMPFSLDPVIFYTQALAILVIVFICLTYPLSAIGRLKIVQALRAG